MPSHWTYDDVVAGGDLMQGDIISRSSDIVSLLKEVYPYFCDERYIGFLVTTQSCDLVRRSGKLCKAQYISLAVVRELRPLLPELLADICGSGIPGVYKKESRYLAEQLLVKIINQNEQSRGIFYLHQDADIGIGAPSIALLRVTFSLRRKHYDILVNSRSGRVRGEFANKLGWLSGNLFSRVATPDWDDQENDGEASRKQAKSLLRLVSETDDQNWVSEEWIREAQRKSVDLTDLAPQTAHSQLEKHAPLEPIEVVLQRMEVIGRELWAGRELKQALQKSREYVETFAKVLVDAVEGLSGEDRIKVTSHLCADEQFIATACGNVSSDAKKVFKKITPTPVQSLLEALSQQRGAIKPLVDKLNETLSNLEISVPDLNVGNATLFSDEVLDHVRVAAEALESEFTERLAELVKRLRTDAHVKTAFRRSSQMQSAILD